MISAAVFVWIIKDDLSSLNDGALPSYLHAQLVELCTERSLPLNGSTLFDASTRTLRVTISIRVSALDYTVDDYDTAVRNLAAKFLSNQAEVSPYQPYEHGPWVSSAAPLAPVTVEVVTRSWAEVVIEIRTNKWRPTIVELLNPGDSCVVWVPYNGKRGHASRGRFYWGYIECYRDDCVCLVTRLNRKPHREWLPLSTKAFVSTPVAKTCN